MMHPSGERTIRWSPLLGEGYSSVTYKNGEKKMQVSQKTQLGGGGGVVNVLGAKIVLAQDPV